MLLVILNTQRMKVKCFCSDMVKKYLIRLLRTMSPEFEDEKIINPFDFWEGDQNFKLKIRKVDGFWNYDKSEFEDTSKLFEDDSEADKVWQSQHSLIRVYTPTNFKSYDELKTRLDNSPFWYCKSWKCYLIK